LIFSSCKGKAKVKTILLKKNQQALVDDEDYLSLTSHSWKIRTTHKLNYAFAKINGRTIDMHRFIMGALPGVIVDHINGNGIDNRKKNLRLCTQQQNMRNQKSHRDAKSIFKGIWKISDCNRWGARIWDGTKRIYLGLFKNELDAARAYDKKASELFGQFAKLNFPAVPS
jgi:hypothetical protein